MSFFDVFALLTSFVVIVISYSHWKYRYWFRKNLPYIQPNFPFGNLENPLRKTKSKADQIVGWYNELKKKGHKHGGVFNFTTPQYLPTSPDLLRSILIKDFQHFTNRNFKTHPKSPLSMNLFQVNGPLWKTLRAKLSPTFTSGKMKMMFETLVKCTEPFEEAVGHKVKGGSAIDIKEMVSSFTMDVIGSCAFGLEVNSFGDPDSDFRRHGKGVFEVTTRRKIIFLLMAVCPVLLKILRLGGLNKGGNNFFTDMVKKTVDYRNQHKITRNDFMQLLMKLNEEDEEFDFSLVVGQAFLFFVAGFETSSTLMTFCLYELTQHREVQEEVRREILGVLGRYGGKVTYEGVQEMKYLQQVLDESLRLHPPVEEAHRTCTKPYQIPGTDVTLEENTYVIIPIKALHHDPEYFPDPLKFDPNRFSPENKGNIHPLTYLPFGDGPRNCIGLRFGLMQAKVGLVNLLKNYRFTLNERTKVPLQMDPDGLVATVVGGIWLDGHEI